MKNKTSDKKSNDMVINNIPLRKLLTKIRQMHGKRNIIEDFDFHFYGDTNY